MPTTDMLLKSVVMGLHYDSYVGLFVGRQFTMILGFTGNFVNFLKKFLLV